MPVSTDPKTNNNPPPELAHSTGSEPALPKVSKGQTRSRQWHYAINTSASLSTGLADLTAHIRPEDTFSPLQLLLVPVLVKAAVSCERGKFDGMAAPVSADLPAERWEAIYRIIREGLGRQKPIRKHELRIYRSRYGRGGWERI